MRNTFDAARLRGALEITKEQDRKQLWHQGDWLVRWGCDTGGCFAGNYAIARGCQPVWHYEDDEDESDTTAMVKTQDGAVVPVSAWVEEELGLTNEEADLLFEGDNSMSRLEYLVDQIIEGRKPYAERIHG